MRPLHAGLVPMEGHHQCSSWLLHYPGKLADSLSMRLCLFIIFKRGYTAALPEQLCKGDAFLPFYLTHISCLKMNVPFSPRGKTGSSLKDLLNFCALYIFCKAFNVLLCKSLKFMYWLINLLHIYTQFTHIGRAWNVIVCVSNFLMLSLLI